MRILQVVRQFHPVTGGVERFTMDLCHNLNKRGHLSDVLTLNRSFDGTIRLPARETIEGINVLRIPFLGVKRIFIAPGVLRYIQGYDVIHIHNIDFFCDYLTLLKPFHKIPLVVSTHGGYFHTRRLRLIKNVYFNTITKMILNRVDQVIADSSHDYEVFSPVVSGIRQLDNGVDFNQLVNVHKKIDPGLMLYIGRLASNKRVDNLVQSLGEVQKTVPYAHLAIVGPDNDNIKSAILELAHELGVSTAVTITGQVSDEEVAKWLGKAHVFVSASEYEAFGISVLEAMSTGTVPVVNSIKSFQNFINHKQNGFLTNFADPVEAAGVIVELLEADTAELVNIGKLAKESASSYSWDNKIDDFIDVYNSVRK